MMDRYVRNFILMSVVYLAVASVIGVGMLLSDSWHALRFVHSHFMLLGWVSMMIYGVGYHVLPRFSGRLLRHPALAEVQFWAANVGLLGMVTFYTLLQRTPGSAGYTAIVGISGALEVISSLLIFYNMLSVLMAKQEQQS